MFSIPEQFSAATKTQFETQLSALNALTAKALESVGQVIDLNLSVAKASFEETTANAKKLLSAKDAQEFMSLTKVHAQPDTEKVTDYGRRLTSIATATQMEFAKAAEAQIAERKRKVVQMMDEFASKAPVGSEPFVAMMKSIFGSANASFEQFSKTTKQVVETLDNNVVTAVKQFAQANDEIVDVAIAK